jgi:hypothetical protein
MRKSYTKKFEALFCFWTLVSEPRRLISSVRNNVNSVEFTPMSANS